MTAFERGPQRGIVGFVLKPHAMPESKVPHRHHPSSIVVGRHEKYRDKGWRSPACLTSLFSLHGLQRVVVWKIRNMGKLLVLVQHA